MLDVKNITKSYSGVTVLNVPELAVGQGESFGLVGNNGAGKTTFFRLVLDLIRANTGHIFLKEEDVSKTTNWKYFTGSYLDQRFLIDFLTPEEYFEFLRNIHGLSTGDLEQFYEEFQTFFNDEILGKKKYVRDLSRGNQQKVGIAAALMTKPELVILDEPFNGLDPSTQIRLIGMLNELKKTWGATLMISSHDLKHVTEVCDRIAVLEKGVIINDLKTQKETLKELESYFAV